MTRKLCNRYLNTSPVRLLDVFIVLLFVAHLNKYKGVLCEWVYIIIIISTTFCGGSGGGLSTRRFGWIEYAAVVAVTTTAATTTEYSVLLLLLPRYNAKCIIIILYTRCKNHDLEKRSVMVGRRLQYTRFAPSRRWCSCRFLYTTYI